MKMDSRSMYWQKDEQPRVKKNPTFEERIDLMVFINLGPQIKIGKNLNQFSKFLIKIFHTFFKEEKLKLFKMSKFKWICTDLATKCVTMLSWLATNSWCFSHLNHFIKISVQNTFTEICFFWKWSKLWKNKNI